MNLGLYLITVLIWGTTWIAIKLQLGEVAVQASILYRFALAGVVMFAVLLLLRRLQPMKAVDHGFCVLQGACLFSINFFCIYNATHYISSGLMSVIFSMATVMNMVNARLWFGQTPSVKNLAGAAIGLTGIATLFWPHIHFQDGGSEALLGIALGMTGTYLFSSGNMISVRHQKNGLRPPTTNAWSMFYGVCLMSALIAAMDVPLTFSSEPAYVWALVYLAIPGTVIGFTAYLMLVGRIGADRAAYATVMFPVVALTVSTLYEGYQWSLPAVLGVCLVISGNILIFARWPVRSSSANQTA
ncbi:EamA family transporter [Bacterioplanes sanyensis]|uniref:EamA family transporter n=1 Tax=Bacterioplanes sanyensis TaxID=1249553 RepID=A0A222FLP2_9GAMM|nr:DMT family transporter [Bacterioplanes sanyensis]ASP39143.1 EamA family transporter [Bacterioplanes sanyensis]